VLTALRSRVNFPRFTADYADCIHSDFTKIYAVARRLSKVSANQFARFIARIGAPVEPAPGSLAKLFNADRIEAIFRCQEYAFDADKLRIIAMSRAEEAGVQFLFSTEATSAHVDGEGLVLRLCSGEQSRKVGARLIFNCTYSRINELLRASRLAPVPLRHEYTEMCLVEPPGELAQIGITVMCGAFFSIMPFPAQRLHSLSHVRYTPHYTWMDATVSAPDPYQVPFQYPVGTAFASMRADARRYLPAMQDCAHRRSLWEVKTILPKSEGDDSRPILFRPCADNPKIINVMGGKIDNVYDALVEVDQVLGQLS
jgi:glycine/D-amino acid oxidase-like deaminating enzyme